MANRIREIRKIKNLTLEDLAESSGISFTHLSRMESGKRGLSLENVLRVAKALGVDPTEVTNEYSTDDMEAVADVAVLAKTALDAIEEIDVLAGLGGGGLSVVENTTVNGITFSKEVVRDVWRLPEWMLTRFNAKPQHIKAFPARGDSMIPTINDGDVVFVDTRHQVPSPPGIYALADEFGGVVVKRLEVISRPQEDPIVVRVSSDNTKHRDRELTLDEIRIIGLYVGRFTI